MRIGFYLLYAARTLRRSGHWTTFAVFCVATGVATVVALRSLGLAISDSLLTNVRQFNHGDINISQIYNFGPFAFTIHRGGDERSVYTPGQVERVRQWITARGGRMTAYTALNNIQIIPAGQEFTPRPQFATSFLIDPQTFAIAADIRAIDPPGAPLADLFHGGREVVISWNLAEANGLKVGDQVLASGAAEPFTVTGIVPTEAEASINNIFASFFGFAYFDAAQAGALQLSPLPNTIGIVLPDGASAEAIEAAAQEVSRLVPVRELTATPSLINRNRELADMIGRFIVTLGLGAMLIGGVGIMNTMLVLVRRRTVEIAALKTFGLKGGQVAALFAAEALLLALAGAALGIAVGVLLSRAVNAYGEAFLQQRLPWRVYPEAIVYGLVLGLVVTLVFGVLPALTAARVRPGIILRPNEAAAARAGLLPGLLAIVVVVLSLGVIAGQILGPVVVQALDERAPNPLLLGIAGVAAALLILAALNGLLWLLVWAIGKLPALGSVDLRLALANLTTRRARTATTLLALTAGMFALSSITFFGLGAREIVRFQFAETLGGNIVAVPLLPEEIGNPLLDLQLDGLEGVESRTRLRFVTGRLMTVDDQPVEIEDRAPGVPLIILSRDTTNPDLRSGPLLAGRDLTPEDRGRNVIVLSEQTALESAIEGFSSLDELGIGVGSTVGVRIAGRVLPFEVVGIVGNANGFTPNPASAYLPPDVPGVMATRTVTVAQVRSDQVDDVLRFLSRVPLVFAVDVAFADGLMERLIAQLSAIPTVVGLLSLLAAAVIMANSVALATLERRQQIGVLKAVGLKRRRVLGVMLLENTLIGLLGSALGIAISVAGVSLMTTIGTGITIPIPSNAAGIALLLVAASVVIAWAATFLSARTAISERVAAVLHYE